MKRETTRLFLCFLILLLCLPGITSAAPEQQTASVIGNRACGIGRPEESGERLPTDQAATLKRMGFNVILRANATQREMDEAVREFGRSLARSDVGALFLCWPRRSDGRERIREFLSEPRLRKKRMSDSRPSMRVVSYLEMDYANNGLNIVLLSMLAGQIHLPRASAATTADWPSSSAKYRRAPLYTTPKPREMWRGMEKERNSPVTGTLSSTNARLPVCRLELFSRAGTAEAG